MKPYETLLEPEAAENSTDYALRPNRIDEFIGQPQHVKNLRTYVASAMKRGEPLDHVLLSGPPGLGKTTLANIVAQELGTSIYQTSGPIIEKKGDLTAILTDLKANDVLFIDEIHRLRTSLEEILYKAMEDFKLDIMVGQGVGAKSIAIDIQPFTLIGATTKSGLLSSPLRDRFGISFHFDFYPAEELCHLIERNAKLVKVTLTDDSKKMIASRSRGTPRIANRLLRRLRDFALVENQGLIDGELAERAFSALGIDHAGFDDVDRKILRTIIFTFAGGPVGLSTLATAIQEERSTIEDVYEPYLVSCGYMHTTSRGRVATEKAMKHFQLDSQGRFAQNHLFKTDET